MTETLNLKNSMLYTLSIRLSAGGFCFSVYNPHQENPLAYSRYKVEPNISLTANLKQALSVNDFLKLPFKRVNILLTTTGYTSIPLELFDEEQMESIYYFNHPKQHNETIYYNILHRSNVVTLFALDKSTFGLINEQYPHAHIYAHISPVIEYLTEQSRAVHSRVLYIYRQRHELHFAAFDHGKLLFVNTYPNHGNNDCIYYALNLWKQLKLDQREDYLRIIEPEQAILDECKKYIAHVEVMPPVTQLPFEKRPSETDFPFDMQALLLTHL